MIHGEAVVCRDMFGQFVDQFAIHVKERTAVQTLQMKVMPAGVLIRLRDLIAGGGTSVDDVPAERPLFGQFIEHPVNG